MSADRRKKFSGPIDAVCADNNDPIAAGRIRVYCPEIWGIGKHCMSPWARPMGCSSTGGERYQFADGSVEVQGGMGNYDPPEQGAFVVIFTRDDNPDDLRYLHGMWGGAGDGIAAKGIIPSQVPGEGKVICPAGYFLPDELPAMCLDCTDKEHAENEYDDQDHKPFHDHSKGQYQCPKHRVWSSETGHSIIRIDHDGKEFYAHSDRMGQCIKFYGSMLNYLQVEPRSDGSLRGNIRPRGMRIMDRRTEPYANPALEQPSVSPAPEVQSVLDAANLTQQQVADAMDGLLTPAVRAALDGTPVGTVLGKLDGATINGQPLKISTIYSAFVAGGTPDARALVTSAMAAVGTSPQGLLAAIVGTPGLIDAATGAFKSALSALDAADVLLTDIFPTAFEPAMIGGARDGYDPRIYCPDQWCAVELRDLYRGFIRLEGAAALEGAVNSAESAAPSASVASALSSIGLTQAAVSDLLDALTLPDVEAVLSGTRLGDVLGKIKGLSLDGEQLTPSAIFDTLTGGATAAARNAVVSLLGTVGLTPASLVSAVNQFSITAPVLSALSSVANVGNLTGLAVGETGVSALSSVLSGIPGATMLGGVLSMFGLLEIGLAGIFPTMFSYVGEKLVLMRSDRDKTRFQSYAIDHMPGFEKIVETTAGGHQRVLDSTFGGRHLVIDGLSGSYELFEFGTGGTKEALYLGGRLVGTGLDDILTVGGDWMCLVGFPPPLTPRVPVDVLPLLDMKASIAAVPPGVSVTAGSGNTLHASVLTSTRWAGLSIFDYATLDYSRVVGAADNIWVAGAQTVTIGAAQVSTIGGVQIYTIGGARVVTIAGADTLTVGAARTVNVTASNIVNCGISVINALTLASHYAVVEYDIVSAKICLYGGSTPTSKKALLPVALATGATCEACGGQICIPSTTVFAAA